MTAAWAQQAFEIDPESYEALRATLRRVAGITLSEAKVTLVSTRLRVRLAQLGLTTLTEYNELLKSLPREDPEWQVLINAMTTNTTSFFREARHFERLAGEVLDEWRQSRQRRPFAVWSAACSTGEEPYTLAMVLAKHFGESSGDYLVAASDIDTAVLRHAENGVYRRTRLAEVPEIYRREAFAMGTDGLAEWVKVRSVVKRPVTFRRVNLLAPPFPWQTQFDVIFCRNVLIYFSPDIIERVVENLFNAAAAGAYLFIGHSESLQGVRTDWRYVEPSIYRKPGR